MEIVAAPPKKIRRSEDPEILTNSAHRPTRDYSAPGDQRGWQSARERRLKPEELHPAVSGVPVYGRENDSSRLFVLLFLFCLSLFPSLFFGAVSFCLSLHLVIWTQCSPLFRNNFLTKLLHKLRIAIRRRDKRHLFDPDGFETVQTFNECLRS